MQTACIAPDVPSVLTHSLRLDHFPDVNVLLLADKFVPAGQSEYAYVVPLSTALLGNWPTDAHLAAYVPDTGVRVKKDNPGSVTFKVALVDLDYARHQGRPSPDDWVRLLRILHVCDWTPNIAYPTRGGARLVYVLTKTVTDPRVYEAHHRALLDKLDEIFRAFQSWYSVDMACGDWTRLYRAPHVIRDGADTYNAPVRIFPDRRPRDLLKLEVPEPEEVERPATISAPLAYLKIDTKLGALLAKMVEGQRNRYLFACVRHAIETYAPEAAERVIGIIIDCAHRAGLEQHEIDTTVASARRKGGA